MEPTSTRVLFVCCGDPDPAIVERHGTYLQWFTAAAGPGVEFVPFDPRIDPCEHRLLDGVDAVVISGSPHSVYDPLPWIAPLESLLREAIHGRALPVLGVCFGHQLVAQACGGRVVKNPRGREIGTAEVTQLPAGRVDALFSALPETFAIQVTHCDTVAAPPPGASVLAVSDLDACQAFAYASAWCVQFHPEFTADIIRAYLEARRERIASEGLDVDALLAGVRETDAGRAIFARFFELVRAEGALAAAG